MNEEVVNLVDIDEKLKIAVTPQTCCSILAIVSTVCHPILHRVSGLVRAMPQGFIASPGEHRLNIIHAGYSASFNMIQGCTAQRQSLLLRRVLGDGADA